MQTMRLAVIAVALFAAAVAAQDTAAAATPAAPADPAYDPSVVASQQKEQLLLTQKLLTELQTVGTAQTKGFEAVSEEVRRVGASTSAAAAAAAAAPAAAAPSGDDDAKVLAAVAHAEQTITKAAGQLDTAVAAVDSAQRQLIGEFAAQKQVLKGVSEGVAGVAAKQTEDAKANTQLAEQLKRIAAAIDAVSEGVKKPVAPAGPSKEEAAATAAARKKDGERLESLATVQRDTNAKLDAIEAAIARLTAAVETAHRESLEGRSFTVRIKNAAAEAKEFAVALWASVREIASQRLQTLRPMVADWIASLHLENRAIALWEYVQQTAVVLRQRAVAEGQVRIEQLSEFAIRNGFPAAHAPLLALSLVLTAALVVAVFALWILSKTLIPVLRKVLSAFAWTVGLIALAIRSVLCCRLCRRSRAAAAGADAAPSKKSKKAKKPKAKSPTAGGAAGAGADDEEPPSEDEIIPAPNTRK